MTTMSVTYDPYLRQITPSFNGDGTYTMTFDSYVFNELKKGLRYLEQNRSIQRKYRDKSRSSASSGHSSGRRSIRVELLDPSTIQPLPSLYTTATLQPLSSLIPSTIYPAKAHSLQLVTN